MLSRYNRRYHYQFFLLVVNKVSETASRVQERSEVKIFEILVVPALALGDAQENLVALIKSDIGTMIAVRMEVVTLDDDLVSRQPWAREI